MGTNHPPPGGVTKMNRHPVGVPRPINYRVIAAEGYRFWIAWVSRFQLIC